jgi:hypothetical protein
VQAIGGKVAPVYGGQSMDISNVIEFLKLAEVVAKLIKLLVDMLKKREKKPP